MRRRTFIVVTIATFSLFFGFLMFFTSGVSIYDLPDWWVSRVDLFRLDGNIRRRFLEERENVGREQRADRTIFGIPLRWRHGCPLVFTVVRGRNLPMTIESGQPCVRIFVDCDSPRARSLVARSLTLAGDTRASYRSRSRRRAKLSSRTE